MTEKTNERGLRRASQVDSREQTDFSDYQNKAIPCLSERDFGDIIIKVENNVSKRHKNFKLGQRESLCLIENLSTEVDSLIGSNLGHCSSN